MKFLYLTAIFLLISCAALERMQKQDKNRAAEKALMERLPFELTYASYANDSLFSKLDIYIGVHFSDLVFEKSDGDSFIARYEINLDFYKLPIHENAGSDSWENQVKVADYAVTQRRNEGIKSLHSYNIKPGKYEMRITVTDMNIPASADYRTKTAVKIINVRDYRDIFSISDIMLVDRVRFWGKNGKAQELSPSFSRSSAKDSILSFYFEMYHLKSDAAVRIFYNIVNKNSEKILSDSVYMNSLYSSIGYLLNVKMKNIPNGTYFLNVGINQDSLYVFKDIYFGYYYWLSADFAIRNLDEAIKQLRYILPEKELKKMKTAQGKEKEKLFLTYWEKRDPSPATLENELMEEYYNRVEFANQHFRFSSREGWETDRGMIYITFGEPDDIVRQTMNANARNFEVWTYWNIKRRRLIFIFVDRYSIGDYQLTEPFDPLKPIY